MGEQDLDRIDVITKYANSFPSYNFEMDTDTKNSRNTMLISEYGVIVRPPISEEVALQLRKDGFRPFVPDMMDFRNKKIIEYQEEPTAAKSGGKLGKKGHDEFSDEDKDLFYQLAGFKQLKIWESDVNWMEKVESFLSPYNHTVAIL